MKNSGFSEKKLKIGFRQSVATDTSYGNGELLAWFEERNITPRTDAGVSGSTTYFYVVMALNSNGESANSNQVTSVVPAP